MTLLDQIRTKIAEALASRDAHQASLDTIVSTVEAEARDLNDAETSAFNEARTAIVATDAQLDQLRARETELADVESRRVAAASAPGRAVPTTAVAGGAEPRTYNPTSERRDGVSFIRDIISWKLDGDYDASQRLQRHMVEERTERAGNWERRDLGTGTFSTGLVVPQFLTDMIAPGLSAMRPTADICNHHVLPVQGMSLAIPRITTNTAVAAQATENSTVQETDIDDTLLTVPVRTIAGQQDISRQAVERATGIDTIVIEDLVRRYHAELDRQILNGDGTAGTHLGIRLTPGIVAVTYTDASPTAAELYPKLADLTSQVQSGVFMGLTHFITAPRRWWWLAKEVGTTFPFLNMNQPTVQAGQIGDNSYGAMNRSIMGTPVVVDGNMSITLGAGAEDVILGVTAPELHLWEDTNAPVFIRAEEVSIATLSVKLVVYGYSAFTAGRYPGAHGTIGGTGTTTPSF